MNVNRHTYEFGGVIRMNFCWIFFRNKQKKLGKSLGVFDYLA